MSVLGSEECEGFFQEGRVPVFGRDVLSGDTVEWNSRGWREPGLGPFLCTKQLYWQFGQCPGLADLTPGTSRAEPGTSQPAPLLR